jgi:hypothetical protein
MEPQPRAPLDWIAWLQWVVATGAGLILGVNSSFALNAILSGLVGPDTAAIAFIVLVSVLVGGWIGVLQWLVLRRRVKRAGPWVLSTMAGWVAGWIPSASILGWVIGATVGLMQWVILRRWVTRASRWLVASVLGWTVAEFLLAAIGSEGISTLTVGLAGAVAGAITGGALVWLMQKPVPVDEPIETEATEVDPRRR